MEQHFKIIAVLQIFMGALAAVLGLMLFGIIAGAGAISGDRQAMLITGTVGAAIGGFLLVLSLPSIIAGVGLLKRREWARILSIVLSIFHLLNIPIGTIVGAYSIWALLQPQAKSYFT
jgi:hypothetical protein